MSDEIKKGHWFKIEPHKDASSCKMTPNKPYKCLRVSVEGHHTKVFFTDDEGNEDWHHIQKFVKCAPPLPVEWEVNQWFEVAVCVLNNTLGKPYKVVKVVKIPGKEIKLTYIDDKGKEDWMYAHYVRRCEAPAIITESIEGVYKFSKGDRVIRIKGPINQTAKLLTTYTVDSVSASDGRLRLDEVGGSYRLANWILESEVTKEEPEITVHGDCIVEGKIKFEDIAPRNLKENTQWQHYNSQTETYSTQPEEETIMSNKIILAVEVSSSAAFATVPAFDVIYGQKVSEMEEQDLFDALRMIDNELEVLKDLGTGKACKRVTAKTAKLKEAKEQVILAIDALPEEGEDE